MTMTLERPIGIRPDVVQAETRAAVDELYAGDISRSRPDERRRTGTARSVTAAPRLMCSRD